uniref:Uncharacterized protein n=1 Tax=Amphora coffeiformis TaxID=265554 RepID=A0A7S3KVZ5_9STRA
MLSWASSQFEKIAQTVAPPPTDPASRFLYCCQRGEEQEAMQLASQLPGSGVIVNQSKQQVPLHVACTYGMMQLTRHLLNQPGASLDMLDSGGNTVLHCAASCAQPVGLDLVKVLVQEMGANVCAKNYQGQTPYDVASLNNIRQFLLPIQLQQETREAIANGGTGLPPGIDMGGLKIQNAPPPPVPGAMGGGPPPPQVGHPPQGMTSPMAQGGPSSPYPQPPNPFGQSITTPSTSQGPSPYPQPPYSGSAPMINQSVTSQQATAAALAPPPPAAQMMGSPPNQTAPPAPGQQQQPATTTSSAPAPASGGGKHEYALTGYSSAAIYKSAPGSGGIRPDGFHSSSSDKRLQQKYGHEQSQQYAHIPPPPSSGSSLGALSGASAGGGGGVGSAPPSGGPNPYAGGLAHRQRQNRYVNYGPVAGNAPAVPRPYSSYGAPAMGAAPAPTQYNVFRPGGGAAAEAVPAPASANMATPAPMPPPPFFQQPNTTAATSPAYHHQQQTAPSYTPAAPTPEFTPPPPQQTAAPAQASSSGHGSPFVQSPVPAAAPSASALFASPANTSSDSASALFSGPPSGNAPATFSSPAPSPTKTASTSANQAPAPAPMASPFASNAPPPTNPAAMFSSPPQMTGGDASETDPPATPPAVPVPAQVAFSNHEVSGVSVMSSASDLFSKPATTLASDSFASPPTASPEKPTNPAAVPTERGATPQDNLVEIAEEEDFDKMDDVPLSPQPPMPADGPPALPRGMPPPPLSNT